MGYMNFFPLEPQESSEKDNDNTTNKEIEAQIQDTGNELWDILKDQENKTIEMKDIEPLPIRSD